jgi:hypothetical protein
LAVDKLACIERLKKVSRSYIALEIKNYLVGAIAHLCEESELILDTQKNLATNQYYVHYE